MRQKTEKVVVTFPTTVSAMAMEAAAKRSGTPGRIIPVPTAISASCGLAWLIEISQEDEIRSFLKAEQLAFEGIFHTLI